MELPELSFAAVVWSEGMQHRGSICWEAQKDVERKNARFI
ncbi:hypothetical protein SBF1_6220002 [Candidatus Desulfosporosinus infrequens]|uniref:Uncharacterized protein n=1 Tax=Candidatus Desulfosporosinus infrequens TaxID=2043169 RepID=A0A2U3LLY6_9FIRM|nr:hypothetical protein SBF1_6220002 [Candidatus Desulfosporosinus infrequens]